MEFRRFKANAVIIEQGEKNQDVFCMISGSVVVEVDGNEIYQLNRQGDIFGEISAASGEPSKETIWVREYLEVIKMSSEILKNIQDDSFHELHHIVYKWFTHILMDKLNMASQKAKKYEKMNQELEEINQDLENDLKIAEETQNACLAKMIEVPFLRTAVRYIPWGRVSGDMYDAILDKEGAFTFFLGDATGHGISAAFFTMMGKVGLSTVSPETPTDDVIRELNVLLSSCTPANAFMTGVFMRITPEGWMTMTNAGHCPVLILPANRNEIISVNPSGLALGIFAQELKPYSKESFELQNGDKIFIYTDGITEYANRAGEMFKQKRFNAFLEEHRSLDLEMILTYLLQTLVDFSGDQKPNDDLTIVGLEYHSQE